MAKKKLSEEDEKNIKLLQNSLSMLEKTKEEAKERGNKKSVKRIEIAQEEVKEHIKEIDRNADTTIKKTEDAEYTPVENRLVKEDKTVYDAIKKEEAHIVKLKEDKKKKSSFYSANGPDVSELSAEIAAMEEPVMPTETIYNDIDPNMQYDVIPLPSNGETYASKTDRLPVAYLTAYDENLITSPNLYRDGLVIDFLLKNKIMTNDFNPENLVSGDADAIIWFLRTTSYGPDFPVNVRDPESGKVIEAVVDLSKLKQKEFTLEGDENGHFPFTLPISKKEIKFKYLTRKEEKSLELLQKIETEGVKAGLIDEIKRSLKTFVENDEVLTQSEKDTVKDFDETLKDWVEKLKKENRKPYTKLITNRLGLQIQAVDGNYDKEYIKKFIESMPAKDSLVLRRYILEHEPGMDFSIEVNRPESLGGGSFKTFLEWDDSIFLNLA